MNRLRKANHIHVTGRSGTGKTSIAERYIVASSHAEIFIFDHQSELFERLGVDSLTSIEETFSHENKRRIKAYDPSYEFAGQIEEAFDYFARRVFSLCRNRNLAWETLLVSDEVQQVSPFHQPSVGLLQCLQTGRRFGVDTLTMSQQPNLIPSQIKSQLTEVYFTQLTEENALKFPASFGMNIQEIMNLKTVERTSSEYLWLNTRTSERRKAQINF